MLNKSAVSGKDFLAPAGFPKTVALVALGPSHRDYIRDALTKQRCSLVFDQVWTVNRGARCFSHDLAFVMDDLRNEAALDSQYGDFLKAHQKPIITSTAYPEFPKACAYPLEDVVRHVGADNVYFHNSIPLVIAYAHALGVRQLIIFGADYTRPDGTVIESDRANVEYWIGWARARYMRVGVCAGSTLLNTLAHPTCWVYGYANQFETAARIKSVLSETTTEGQAT